MSRPKACRTGNATGLTQLRYKALPKQVAFLKAADRCVLYSGAYGAGKSWALALKTALRASRKGAVEGLCRKHLVTLKATTLRTLLEGAGDVPPVLPQGSYTHNKSDKLIRIRNGGVIQYFGLDDPEKAGSLNLSGCGVDEAVEVTAADWRMLLGRIRVDAGGMPNQLYAACNPGPPSHHLAVEFGLSPGGSPAPGRLAIQTSTAENHYLPPDYITELSRMSGLARARYFEGRWVGSDKLVYDTWLRESHVRPRFTAAPVRIIVGVDDGYTNPFAVVRVEVDGDGRAHIARVHYETRLQLPDKARIVREFADGAEAVLVDPSAPDVIDAFKAANIPARGADNAVQMGIARVQARLADPGDGRPRLTVEPGLEPVIREFESYEWKLLRKTSDKMKDEPVKENDHALDATRYAINYLDSGVSFGVSVYDSAGRKLGTEAVRTFDPFSSDVGWQSLTYNPKRPTFIG